MIRPDPDRRFCVRYPSMVCRTFRIDRCAWHNDCNEIIDDGGTFVFYADADNDGFGNENEFLEACSPPEGYVSNGDDCDDIDTTISPTATELCDGIDNNCNNQIDTDANDQFTYYQDNDEDGIPATTLREIALLKD